MSLRFRLVKQEELGSLCEMYRKVIADMRRRGLNQWEWGMYPNADILGEDIAAGTLYRMDEDGSLVGAFVLCPRQEEGYARLSWHFGLRPVTLHRLALDPECLGLGLGQRAMVFVKEEARRLGYDSLRLDTSSRNERALKLFRGSMTREVGVIHFDDPTIDFYCFESPLGEACPILPIRMHPAYRYGDMTPWGGDGLRSLYGMDIPEERTGEALVVSAIPGLESRDDTGVRLTKLIARYGKALVGQDREFPLLLKFIAAKESLSVQVHPGDAYAREHEGKLGKTEAWVILHAQEGARLVYGLQAGVEMAALEAALQQGEDLEPLLRQVPVQAGDVFYMPSGMVHAIGGGIVLYEIQQSSDVTYRVWDYGRLNGKGEPRELHIRQALDVIDPRLAGEKTRWQAEGASGFKRLLSVPAFMLDSVLVEGELALSPRPESFRLLTALDPLTLAWDGAEMALGAGESALLAVSCPALALRGKGRALLAAAR
ncbi:MAG: type I phosphomannose isomerase catalytic subunit [Candidatus Limiplasma sp.]|nr:type I phosphomannose isomerase catalytic subunit [Candidatus Limiplasma sp.]